MMVLAVRQETVTSSHTNSNVNQDSTARERRRQKCVYKLLFFRIEFMDFGILFLIANS